MEKLQLLESVLGKGRKSNRDYYQFICPFHQGKNGPKLGISLGTGGWQCWVCEAAGHSVQGLFKKMNLPPERIKEAKIIWNDKFEFKAEETTRLQLPKEFRGLWIESNNFFHQKALNYLFSRGVTREDIIKHRIGFCETGKYQDMIIFPSYDESGKLVFLSGRSYLNNPQKKFIIPMDVDKNQVFDENMINWTEPVIIVESKLDAITIRRNAIPIYGKKIPEKVKIKIISEKTPKVIFCLDGDALKDAMTLSNYFISNGVEVEKVNFPETEDPNSLGFQEVWKYIKRAEKVTESNNFQFKILNMLR